MPLDTTVMSSTPSLHIQRRPCGRTAAVAAHGMGSHATSTNHVIGLDLSCSWLREAIHCNNTLFLLLDLRWLSLAGNDFYGSQISPKFGTFTRMTHLDLSGSSFQGIIPLEMISPLSKLVKLSLSDNYDLTIDDDHSFRWLVHNLTQGNLCRLSSLALGGINLSLDFEIFARLKNLESLELSQNLTLDNNLFQGPLPRSLENCTSLAIFVVRLSGIHDTFPHWWLNATLNSLEYLDLQSNKFHGVINEIPLSPTLNYLILSNKQFFGQMLINFFRDSSAEFIDIDNNNFDSPLPIPPPTILFYSISSNMFSGDIPHQLCSAIRIEIINLSNNNLTSSVPHCFIKLTLSVLDLQENKLVSQILKIFVRENNLRTIQLIQN
ncbi:receptor-like protein 9DC3 [Punica granatum]|uniref:Receptor-like protein 9DC3 n=1 Tax=Punica granatum TaxID=22663 RepID=A0A6P8BY54_PUNGR|nr:receptor-like protein 9DC3 [Punica granatum]